jgi:two-component system chemotaxis sensor kinase CheA
MAELVTEEYRKLFLEESQDMVDDWEQCILLLEKDPANREHIDRLFRDIHTLKGSAGFVHFEMLQKVAHELESALQNCRDGESVMSPELAHLMLEGHDLCVKMIESFSKKRGFKSPIDPFIEKLHAHGAAAPRASQSGGRDNDAYEQEEYAPEDEKNDDAVAVKYRIKIKIDADRKEATLRTVLAQSRLAGIARTIEVNPPFSEIGKMEEGRFLFELTVETAGNEIDLRKSLNIDQVAVLDLCRFETTEAGGSDSGGAGEAEEPGKPESGPKKTEEVVRVTVEKLDAILNLVGELVIQNSGFISTTKELRDRYGMSGPVVGLEEKTESLAKIARDLQDAVMKVRMLPVATVFNRFHRVVRDLARDRGKSVELTIQGEETEIDKKVIDRIAEPLVHMIRNAVDHGIEKKNDRIAFGKDEAGHIALRAYQEGDHICIEVEDDGIGLDREKIIETAVKQGYMKREDAREMSDADVFRYILLPGFSTAEEVSDISGRGVGLDVVRRTVEEMGGDLLIRSMRGLSTVVTITLPLTMAIIPAILLQSGHSLFAIPLSSVREVLKMKRKDLRRMRRSTVVELRDEVISVAELRDVLELCGGWNGNGGAETEKPAAEPPGDDGEIAIVIVDYGGKKIGVGVNKLLGNEEIVIKSLSRHYKEVEGLVGASILGNGKIVLILDVEAMVRRYYRDELETRAGSGLHARDGRSPEVGKPDSERRTAAPRTASLKSGESSRGKTAPARRTEDGPVTPPGETGGDREREEKPGETGSADFEKEQMELLNDINTSGAVIATVSMTELMGKDIRVSFPEVKALKIGEVASALFGEEEKPVGGIYVGIKGEVHGGVLTVLPMQYLLHFSDLLYGRAPGSSTELDRAEVSGLTEMANILSASFIRAMADTTGLTIMQEAPEMRVDICLSVIDSVLARFDQQGDRILLTEARLYYGETEQAICYLLLFLEPASRAKLVRAAKGDAVEALGGL